MLSPLRLAEIQRPVMFNMITGIELGKHGVLLKTKTRDSFVSLKSIDKNDIYRIGCRVSFQVGSIEFIGSGRFGTPIKRIHYSFWNFADLQDAKKLMTWIIGTQEDKCI